MHATHLARLLVTCTVVIAAGCQREAGSRDASREPASREPASRESASREPVSREPASRETASREAASREPGAGAGDASTGALTSPPAESPTSSASGQAPSRRHTIVFAGTSLTAGLGLDPDSAYPHLIQRKLDSAGLDFEAVNAGVSGETTAGLLSRLGWLLRGQFDVFVIESGANDGLRGVPVEAIEQNLRAIIRRVREARPGAEILLVQMEALPNYGRSYGTAFHDLYVRVAREERVGLLPFLLEGVAGRPELNQGDGVHPNVEGERIVAENVWRGLRPWLDRRVKAP